MEVLELDGEQGPYHSLWESGVSIINTQVLAGEILTGFPEAAGGILTGIQVPAGGILTYIQEATGGISTYTQVLIISFLPEFSVLLALLGTFQLAFPVPQTLGYSGVRRMTEGKTLSWKLKECTVS